MSKRSTRAAGWRVGLLALVTVYAAGNSAFGSNISSDAREYVDAHNAARAGVQRPADYPGSWAPLPPVAWSDQVASGAQAWAEHLRGKMKCGLMHSDTRDGENLAGGKKVDAAGAVRMWVGEKDKYRYSPRYEFEPRSAHFTQVVWRKTTHIGCARATCGRSAVVVCRYRPAGNHIGKAPF